MKILSAVTFLLGFALVPFLAPAQTQQKEETVKGFSFSILDGSGQKTYITGSQAVVQSEGVFQLTQVTAYTYQNDVPRLEMFTPKARADITNGHVESDEEVIFKSPGGMVIRGKGLTMDSKTKSVSVRSQVYSMFPPQKEPRP